MRHAGRQQEIKHACQRRPRICQGLFVTDHQKRMLGMGLVPGLRGIDMTIPFDRRRARRRGRPMLAPTAPGLHQRRGDGPAVAQQKDDRRLRKQPVNLRQRQRVKRCLFQMHARLGMIGVKPGENLVPESAQTFFEDIARHIGQGADDTPRVLRGHLVGQCHRIAEEGEEMRLRAAADRRM